MNVEQRVTLHGIVMELLQAWADLQRDDLDADDLYAVSDRVGSIELELEALARATSIPQEPA